MARTRHKRVRDKPESQARVGWKRDDEVELLALLDYKLSTTKDAGSSMISFVNHLRNSRHTEYTAPQIERKIRKFWTANRHHAATNPNEIYRLGTKCLPHLSNDFREKVRERVGTLKDLALAQRLESPRQLRSTSRSADSGLSLHIRLGMEVAETLSPRKRYRKPHTSNADLDGWRPRKQRGAESGLDQDSNAYSRQKWPKEEDEADSVGLQSRLRIVRDSEDDLTNGDGRDSPTVRLHYKDQSSPSTVDFSLTPRQEKIVYSEEPGSTGRQQSADLEDSQREPLLFQRSYKELQEAQNENTKIIRSLRHDLFLVLEDRKELRQRLELRDDTYRVLSQLDKQSIIKRLNENEEEISGLQEALHNKQWLRSFSTLSSKNPMPFQTGKVEAGMASISHSIQQILSEYEDDSFFMTPSFEGGHELNSLLRRSLALDLSETPVSMREAFGLFTFSLQAILRTLIASSLCEWVFEADLPGMSETPCALLKKYRLQLGLQDGETALRNLDFAAHASLIEEDFFQKHVIPARASVLASRVLRTLAPFFVQSESLEDLDDEVIGTLSAKRLHLEEVFASALRIKAQATVSKDQFEMVLYSPGTRFDQDAMVAETMDGGRAAIPFSITPKVKLCLLPSLHVYEHDGKLVDLNNFVRRPNGQRSAATKLTKAVVVLENTQALPS